MRVMDSQKSWAMHSWGLKGPSLFERRKLQLDWWRPDVGFFREAICISEVWLLVVDKEVVFAVQLWSEVPPWLTRVVFKGSYRNPEVKDERVGSESTVGRVEWDEEKHVNEDLQTDVDEGSSCKSLLGQPIEENLSSFGGSHDELVRTRTCLLSFSSMVSYPSDDQPKATFTEPFLKDTSWLTKLVSRVDDALLVKAISFKGKLSSPPFSSIGSPILNSGPTNQSKAGPSFKLLGSRFQSLRMMLQDGSPRNDVKGPPRKEIMIKAKEMEPSKAMDQGKGEEQWGFSAHYVLRCFSWFEFGVFSGLGVPTRDNLAF
ncbi:hypothetical protein CK203_046687 [Vitis vinifera]|uniref:DUF4283 domain-containing protein n=1 Tax=Vitis vinifera TaxID=29760 RepID=A0A438HK01_VITVI|nr:hypothetical protein CK203_046687 [Vitis vinifera]